jgi:hypothetical protein
LVHRSGNAYNIHIAPLQPSGDYMTHWRMRWRPPWNATVMCQLIILCPMILSNIFGMAGGYDGRCQRDLFSSVVRGGRQHFWSSWFTFKSQRSDHSIYFQQLQDSDITKVVELFTCLSLETYFNFGKDLMTKSRDFILLTLRWWWAFLPVPP